MLGACILNVHEVSDVRQAEIHIAEPLEPEPSALEVELAIEKLKRHKWSWLRIGTDGGHLWVRWETFEFHKCGEFFD
jgi:hypothetical protein